MDFIFCVTIFFKKILLNKIKKIYNLANNLANNSREFLYNLH